MSKSPPAQGIHLVTVSEARTVEDTPVKRVFMIASVPRDQAAERVLEHLNRPEGWKAELHSSRLSEDDVRAMGARNDEVRELDKAYL